MSKKAEYGQQVIESLSQRMAEKFGKGFTSTNLKYMRKFYLNISIMEKVKTKTTGIT